MCILRELYGVGVEKLRIEHQTITVSVRLYRCFHLAGVLNPGYVYTPPHERLPSV